MNIKQFVEINNIGIQFMKVAENPSMTDSGREMNNYFVSLNIDGDTKNGMALFFSMGTAINHPPTVSDVLECLKSDIPIGVSFKEFCNEFGYDTDSRQAEKTYDACLEQTEKLKKWLGPTKFEELDGLDLD